MNNIGELNSILDNKIKNSNQVLLMPHEYIDADALASCVGMNEYVKKYDKPCYIIINDDFKKMDSGIKLMLSTLGNRFNIINLDDYNSLKSDNDLIITLDVNKEDLLCSPDIIKNNNNIVVIDHHNVGKTSIKKGCIYIDTNSSSASEILENLLDFSNIKYDEVVATILLAGIHLDTINLPYKITTKTMFSKARLMKNGAKPEVLQKFFTSSFESDRKVQELVSKANFITNNIAICIADESIVYTKSELAKVANYLLKFKIDASFAAGFIDDELIQISARSNGNIDVCKIMEQLGGGGTNISAATSITDKSIIPYKKKLETLIKDIK